MSINSRKTPYYLLDLEKVKTNFLSLQKSINSVNRNDIIAYSVKANYNPAIIELLKELGAFFEVCSNYEYDLMQSYGISASRIIVNGCFYNDFSKYKGSILIIDTFQQLLEWLKNGSREKIGIRVNLDCITVDERFHNKKSRFGLHLQTEQVRKLLKEIDTRNIICLHCHLSGNNREPSIYRDIISQLQKICNEYQLNDIKYIDIGGGYKIDSKDSFWNFADYVNEVSTVSRQDIQIIFEPGNSLVRNCAEYHTEVIVVKEIGNENIFIVDGSTLHIPKSITKTTEFHFEHISKGKKYSGQRLYGNTCKESDLMLMLNDNEMIAIGDHLIIENIGAYSLNEVNPLILGVPNVYLKTDRQIVIGNHLFNFVYQCSDSFNKRQIKQLLCNKRNIFRKGLYAFVRNDTIIYIGATYGQHISERFVPDFKKGSVGLRKKIFQIYINELEECSFYFCPFNDTKQNLLIEEALLIGLCKPKLNYL